MKKWFLLQLVIVLAAAIVLLAAGPNQALSFVAGGVAVFAGNLWVVLRVGSQIGQIDSQVFLRKAVVAEVMKFVVAGTLCVIAFRTIETLDPPLFFGGFALALLVNMMGLKYIQQAPRSK